MQLTLLFVLNLIAFVFDSDFTCILFYILLHLYLILIIIFISLYIQIT